MSQQIVEDTSARRLGCHLMDMVGDLGINVLAYRIGQQAEGGWELVAFEDRGTQRWRVEADTVYEAAVELAALVGLDVEG